MLKIICPFHEERTPSCVLYSDNYVCFGCGKRGPRSELSGEYATVPIEDPEPENLAQAYEYIDSLPLTLQRGLMLPTDRRGFYVPWPNRTYYKYRFFEPTGPKYVGAKGHKKPPFLANLTMSSLCFLVEGELNALSLVEALPEASVISPGGAGDFSSDRIKKYYTVLDKYSTIVLVVDEDEAGAKAVISSMPVIKQWGKRVISWLMKPDANDLLQGIGSAGLRQEVLRVVGEKMEKGP